MPSFTWTNLFTNTTTTKSAFITNIRSRIDEDNSDSMTDVQIGELIRQGNYDINFRTRLLPEYSSVSLDGSASYTLPTDMSEIDELVYIDTASPANYTVIEPTNYSQLQDKGYDLATPRYYIREGQNIVLFGSSISTGTLRAYGSRIPTFPETDSAYIDLPNQYLELMYLWCEWKFWARRREADEEVLKRTIYFEMLKLVSDQVESQYQRGVSAYG